MCIVKNYGFLTVGCLSSRWILSKAKKDDTDDEIAKYDGESYPYFDLIDAYNVNLPYTKKNCKSVLLVP